MSSVRSSHVAWLAAGGAIGATLRVALGQLAPTSAGDFPLATLGPNAVGALMLGALLVGLRDRFRDGSALYLFACTGILGSFTTFSALSLELVELAHAGRFGLAVLYAFASVTLGLTAALAGMRATAWLACAGRRTP